MDIERNEFISAMRRVANSVTVVTTNGAAGRHGATVSAFCSVSADPPTVLVCLNAKSRIARLVAENGHFNVNVLPDNAMGIANRFCGNDDEVLSDRFQDVEIGPDAVPSISGATIFKCIVGEVIPSGSHLITTGLVQSTHMGNTTPLTHFNGAYHEVKPLTPVLAS